MGKGNERSFRRMEKELKDLAGRKKEMVLPEEGHLLQTVSLVREAYRTEGSRWDSFRLRSGRSVMRADMYGPGSACFYLGS